MPNKQILVLIFFLTLIPATLAFQTWERPIQPPAAGQLRAVLPHPLDPSRLILASRSEIFEKTESGSWKNIWQTTGSSEIHRLLFFKELPDSFFVLTKDGVFRCKLNRYGCSPVYQGISPTEKSALSFGIYPSDKDHWFVGTEGGLFESDDAGKTWFRFRLKRAPVPILRFARGRMFMALGDVLYVSEDLAHFRPVFSVPSLSFDEADTESPKDNADEENPANQGSLFDLFASEEMDIPLWLATADGVFESRDNGQNWRPLSQSGLRSSSVQHLVYSKTTHQLFAGTLNGVYVYRENLWREIFEGMSQPKVFALSLISQPKEMLVALTPEGFLNYPVLPDANGVRVASAIPAEKAELLRKLIQLEPPPIEMQKSVMRFSNLRNGKIKRWQNASRLAALVPSLSFGRDFSRKKNVDVDRAGTNNPDIFIEGPPNIDNGWDARVTWNFSDFIWSTNQTNIDSREKLMVELRNDMLAEATRIYYERRRLQMDLVFNPAESEFDHYDKLLRIDELTSMLDGMSGGWFSKKVEKAYQIHPELSRLWEYAN